MTTAPYSASWSWNAGRAYWLPPGGISDGLDARTWAAIIDIDSGGVSFLLDALREAGIPGYACRRHRKATTGPVVFRIWVHTWACPRAEDVIGTAMATSGMTAL